jgi:hypothetical protein
MHHLQQIYKVNTSLPHQGLHQHFNTHLFTNYICNIEKSQITASRFRLTTSLVKTLELHLSAMNTKHNMHVEKISVWKDNKPFYICKTNDQASRRFVWRKKFVRPSISWTAIAQ